MHRNQYLIDMCIMEGCTVLNDSCTECGMSEDWKKEMKNPAWTDEQIEQANAEAQLVLITELRAENARLRDQVSTMHVVAGKVAESGGDSLTSMAQDWQTANKLLRLEIDYWQLRAAGFEEKLQDCRGEKYAAEDAIRRIASACRTAYETLNRSDSSASMAVLSALREAIEIAQETQDYLCSESEAGDE